MKRRPLIRALTIVAGAALGLTISGGTALATPTTDSPSQAKFECPTEENLNNVTGHGANNNDGYQSTCDPIDFGGNGQEFGPGNQTGKPCAGCVGNADDKNPPGQYPDGSDHNSGYECDGRDRPFHNQNGNGNHGVGDENPAHTGCDSTVPPPVPPTCPDGSPMTDTNNDGVVNEDDCTPPVPPTCPDGSPMPAGGAEDCAPDEAPTCPDGSPMTDTNNDGAVNEDDCTPPKSDTPTPPTDVPEEVLPLTIIGPATPSSVEETPQVLSVTLEETPQVLGLTLEAAPETTTTDEVRPTAVLGEQLERPATNTAQLARTGSSSNGFLAALAVLLLALGTALVRIGRRPSAS